MKLLHIAFRNLLRAKRRNALSGGTMVLGSAALVLGNGLSDGIARQLTANLVAVQTGHVQVVVRPDDFQPQNSPFDAYGSDHPLQGLTEIARLGAHGYRSLGRAWLQEARERVAGWGRRVSAALAAAKG